jgi:hypothetical protein
LPEDDEFLLGSCIERVFELGGFECLAEVIPILDVLGVEVGEVAARGALRGIFLHYIIVVVPN